MPNKDNDLDLRIIGLQNKIDEAIKKLDGATTKLDAATERTTTLENLHQESFKEMKRYKDMANYGTKIGWPLIVFIVGLITFWFGKEFYTLRDKVDESIIAKHSLEEFKDSFHSQESDLQELQTSTGVIAKLLKGLEELPGGVIGLKSTYTKATELLQTDIAEVGKKIRTLESGLQDTEKVMVENQQKFEKQNQEFGKNLIQLQNEIPKITEVQKSLTESDKRLAKVSEDLAKLQLGVDNLEKLYARREIVQYDYDVVQHIKKYPIVDSGLSREIHDIPFPPSISETDTVSLGGFGFPESEIRGDVENPVEEIKIIQPLQGTATVRATIKERTITLVIQATKQENVLKVDKYLTRLQESKEPMWALFNLVVYPKPSSSK